MSGRDRFGDLPDDLLWHVLSFLPLGDALQTCVLDTRWRDHWRRTTDLPLYFNESSFPSSEGCKQIVKLFIHLRGNSPLDKLDISAYPEDDDEGTYTNTMLLIEYALKCQVKELLLGVDYFYPSLTLDVPLISQHLKTILLEEVTLETPTLNFSRCPALEDLEMQNCYIEACTISSKSLKHLCITNHCNLPEEFHVRIFAPGLISLQLDDFTGLTPSLEYMPFLVTAYVGLSTLCRDVCRCILRGYDVKDCSCHSYPVDEGMLLHGLSNAVNLELIAAYRTETFFYSWDLKCCPIFDKLTTLLLNEWFTAIDLVCILQHTPILEMLTLQLENTEKLVSTTGDQETAEQSFVCAHLKVVNIECRKIDEGIHKIVNILSTRGILREQINIKEPCSRSYCFSFKKLHAAAAASTIDGA